MKFKKKKVLDVGKMAAKDNLFCWWSH